MNYSLGNMLGGSNGSLNPDKLSLNLQFATDKTLTARRGPTPTFTRASTATFVGSDGLIQSAAINQARFDHDPVTLASKGLLIEESRTNLVFPSDTLTTQTRTVTAVAHTLSFYGTGTVVLSGVAIATVTGTGAYPTRTTLTFTPTAGSLTLTVTGSVTQAQLEAGSFATSYIPTTTASVVRSADVCSITGSAFTGMYNATEGSVTAQFNLLASASDPSFQGVFEFSDGTTSNRMRSSRSNTLLFRNTTSGSLNMDINAGTLQPNIVHKAAYGFALNSFALVANNGTVVTDNVATMPTGVNILDLGNNPQSSSTRLNGHLASFRYYKKRLTDVKLKSLTV